MYFVYFVVFMSFAYLRTVHFADTDAAGVVFFANYLSICHEAYEESLAASGIELKTFFTAAAIIVPVSKSEAEYLRSLACGDKLSVTVAPTLLSEHTFELRFGITRLGTAAKIAARVRTEHVCISTQTRQRTPLPPALAAWVKAR